MFDIEVGAVLPAGNRLANKAQIELADLSDQTLISLSRADVISRQLDELSADTGIKMHRSVEVSLGSTLCNLVAEGAGIGLVDAETYHCCRGPALVWRPFAPFVSMPISLLRSQRRPPSRMEHEFIKHLYTSPPVMRIE